MFADRLLAIFYLLYRNGIVNKWELRNFKLSTANSIHLYQAANGSSFRVTIIGASNKKETERQKLS